jgi:hypothetical protein
MLDYLFFNQSIADQFIDFMNKNKLEWTQETEKIQNAIILKTSDELEDDLWDALDDFYDLLSLEDARLSDANTATEEDIEAVGVYIQLQNGEQTIAQVDLLIMNRILEVISMDEFNDFIEAIVSSVEKPNDAAICQKTLL